MKLRELRWELERCLAPDVHPLYSDIGLWGPGPSEEAELQVQHRPQAGQSCSRGAWAQNQIQII